MQDKLARPEKTTINMEEDKIKIQFEDGAVRTLRPVQPSQDDLKKYFSNHTGLNYNEVENGYLFWSVTKALKNWLNKYGLHHPAAAGLILAAEGIIAANEANDNNGFVAFTEEDHECLIVCPYCSDPYAWRISKMIYDDIAGRRISSKKRIVYVNLLNWEKEDTVGDLTEQISQAVAVEDYELAATLRNRIDCLKAR